MMNGSETLYPLQLIVWGISVITKLGLLNFIDIFNMLTFEFPLTPAKGLIPIW